MKQNLHSLKSHHVEDYLPRWPGLGLPRPKAIVVIPKINSCQNHLRKKKRVKVRSTPGHYKKRSDEITMHLDLDNN